MMISLKLQGRTCAIFFFSAVDVCALALRQNRLAGLTFEADNYKSETRSFI